jgi:hypothetical protein
MKWTIVVMAVLLAGPARATKCVSAHGTLSHVESDEFGENAKLVRDYDLSNGQICWAEKGAAQVSFSFPPDQKKFVSPALRKEGTILKADQESADGSVCKWMVGKVQNKIHAQVMCTTRGSGKDPVSIEAIED